MPITLVGGILESLRIGFGFLWVAPWAIFMGFTFTSLVQVFVSKKRMTQALGNEPLSNLTKSAGFGALSSGCSFGATAIGKGLFKKGSHPTNVRAFTNNPGEFSYTSPVFYSADGQTHDHD